MPPNDETLVGRSRPFDMSADELRERTQSIRVLVRALCDPDLRVLQQDRSFLLNMALWRLTEFGRTNRLKYGIRYRSRQVVDGPSAAITHEHVVPRKWIVGALLQHPSYADDFLKCAVACVVTKDEHVRLSRVDRNGSFFGWERYVVADIEVLDAAERFRRLDLEPLSHEQRKLLESLPEVR